MLLITTLGNELHFMLMSLTLTALNDVGLCFASVLLSLWLIMAIISVFVVS